MAFLKTQVGLITSERVLNPAVCNPLVVKLPTIRKFQDPIRDLRDKLKVEIVDETSLIRVALELPDGEQAATIVKAVIQYYLTQYNDYSRSANRELMDSLGQQVVKIRAEIDNKRSLMKDLSKKGNLAAESHPLNMLNSKSQTDPSSPTLKGFTKASLATMIERLVQCDLEYLEAVAYLEAARSFRERNLVRIDDELETRAAEEFKRDPRVVALLDQIDEFKKLAQSNDQPSPLPVLAAREKHEKLSKEYEALWASKRPGIRKRLAAGDQGLLSEAKFRELDLAVEKARRKKESFAQHFGTMQGTQEESNENTFEVTYLTHQLNTLMVLEDQVKKNLERLNFEAGQDKYRVVLVDPATVSKIPSNDKRLKLMAAAPAAAFLLLLGVLLLGGGSGVSRIR